MLAMSTSIGWPPSSVRISTRPMGRLMRAIRFCFSICRAISSVGIVLADGIQSARVQVASWSPVVEMSRSTGSANERARTGVQLLLPKRTPRSHQIVGNLPVILIGAIQLGQVDLGRVGEGKIADRVVLGERDDWPAAPDLGLKRRRGRGGDEQRSEGAQQARGGDVELGLVLVEMPVAALQAGMCMKSQANSGSGSDRLTWMPAVASEFPYRSTQRSR